jgi:tRNA(Met) cytidine acetyltransferase
LSQAPQNILVVTPTLSAVSPLLEQAARFWPDSEAYNSGLRGDDRHLRVIRPSELSQTLPDAHLVLVDEAAALPVPLLVRLLVNYPRVVFSTTIHGYEGTGQGFALRFQQHLDRETPHWHQFVLSEPIRWAPYDPVERLVLEALCLKTELSVIPHVDSHGDDIHIRLLNRDELEANETLLNQVFTLLIDAHYRTSPLDLARLLDAPNMRIWVASQGEMITGVSLVAEEGGLSQAMAEHVSIGERRLKGHLLPQTMCAHMGFIPAATQIAWRIVRIAVAKSHRRQGIGGRLMDAVETEAKAVQVDYLGAAFGAMVALLKFWESKDFSLMRIGARRGPANGLHAAVVAKTVSRGSMRWFSEARSRFERSFSRQLTGPLRSLEVETVSHGIRSVFTLTPSPKLTTHEWSELHAFSRGGRPFEAVYDLLWVFTHFRLQVEDSLPYAHVSTRDVLVRSVLQGWEWSGLTACSGVSGRGDAVGLIAADVASNLDSIRARIEL